jgi:hypothetical protein
MKAPMTARVMPPAAKVAAGAIAKKPPRPREIPLIEAFRKPSRRIDPDLAWHSLSQGHRKHEEST